MKAHDALIRSGLRTAVAAGLVLLGLLPYCAQCQISPSQADSVRNEIGSRVEALTILGGDFGLAGGSYRFSDGSDVEMDVSKFGGSGDVGEPRRLGDSGIAWQPTLQGSMGFVDADTTLHSGPLRGGTNEFRAFAIQFGAGARFWFNDRFSLAPTLMAMYGHTSSEYAPTTASAQANVVRAIRAGLIDWNEGTWALRPAVNIQYILTWDRTRITLSSDPTFFHTESFASSDAKDFVNGNSGSLANKIDVDVPLGKYLFGRELHTGGFISRTELLGDLEDGLGTQHLYEFHGRLVLDTLNQLWKTQWIGVGGSYLRGVNANGWTVGADVAFRF